MLRTPTRVAVDATLEAAVTPMVALPVPDVVVSEAQGAPLDAVHEQLAPLVTIPSSPLPPLAAYGSDPRELVSTVTVQANASCVMTNDWPPIVSAPDRATVVGFGSTV
jgi:hypothetical protein